MHLAILTTNSKAENLLVERMAFVLPCKLLELFIFLPSCLAYFLPLRSLEWFYVWSTVAIFRLDGPYASRCSLVSWHICQFGIAKRWCWCLWLRRGCRWPNFVLFVLFGSFSLCLPLLADIGFLLWFGFLRALRFLAGAAAIDGFSAAM